MANHLILVLGGRVDDGPIIELLEGTAHVKWRGRVEMLAEEPLVGCFVDDLVQLGCKLQVFSQGRWRPPGHLFFLLGRHRSSEFDAPVPCQLREPATETDAMPASPRLELRRLCPDYLCHPQQALFDLPVQVRHLGASVNTLASFDAGWHLTNRAISLGWEAVCRETV